MYYPASGKYTVTADQVRVIPIDEALPENAHVIGSFSISKNGGETGTACNESKAMQAAKVETSKAGGNAFKITRYLKPDAKFPCNKIAGVILEIKDSSDITNATIQEHAAKVALEYKKKAEQTQSADYTAYEEIMPTFPGGFQAMNRFISLHSAYPENAEKDCIAGTVHVSFIIRPNGSLADFNISKSLREDLDKEALRLCSLLPYFMPGFQNGKAVSVRFTVPVRFTAKCP